MHRFFFAFVLFAVLALPQAVRAQSAPTASVSTLDECYLGDSVPFRIMIERVKIRVPPPPCKGQRPDPMSRAPCVQIHPTNAPAMIWPCVWSLVSRRALPNAPATRATPAMSGRM